MAEAGFELRFVLPYCQAFVYPSQIFWCPAASEAGWGQSWTRRYPGYGSPCLLSPVGSTLPKKAHNYTPATSPGHFFHLLPTASLTLIMAYLSQVPSSLGPPRPEGPASSAT